MNDIYDECTPFGVLDRDPVACRGCSLCSYPRLFRGNAFSVQLCEYFVDRKTEGTPFGVLLFCLRGFVIPESWDCGFTIHAGRRPAVIILWIWRSTGTEVDRKTEGTSERSALFLSESNLANLIIVIQLF